MKALQQLNARSNSAWAMALTLVSGMVFAQTQQPQPQPTKYDPATEIGKAVCSIYDKYLSNTGLIFAVVLVIVAWAGYMIYMGKREASDVIIKAVIATAIVLGAKALAGAILGSTGSCP